MAQVKLGRYEAEEGQLPPLCVCCGAPATHYKAQWFSWQPAWSYLVFGLTIWPLLFLGVLLRKRMRVLLPFCDAHRRYLLLQKYIGGGLLAVLLGVLIACLGLVVQSGEDGVYAVHPFFLFWLDGLPIMIALLLLRIGTIRATEITDDSITLGDVALDFVKQREAERIASP